MADCVDNFKYELHTHTRQIRMLYLMNTASWLNKFGVHCFDEWRIYHIQHGENTSKSSIISLKKMTKVGNYCFLICHSCFLLNIMDTSSVTGGLIFHWCKLADCKCEENWVELNSIYVSNLPDIGTHI